jgi:hypothetical protein
MTQREDVDERLQRLLRSRKVPVDEERLEGMRESLLRRAPRREPLPATGFLHPYRFALSFGMALVLIGLLAWQFYALRHARPPLSVASKLMRVVEDEEQMDHVLLLLSGFASTPSQGRPLVDWEFYNRSLLVDCEGENLLETFYGQSHHLVDS